MAINMANVLGLVFANMHDRTVTELTKQRTMGSILFGGRYRLIDFPLSNMVNSGMSEVGVITKSNYQSLLDHLGSAREWDLSRKKGGLHILPPFGHVETGLYRGRLEALYGAMGFIKSSLCDYVVLSDCDVVTNMDFRPIVTQHIDSGADITVVTTQGIFSSEETLNSTVVAVGADNSKRLILLDDGVVGVGECPAETDVEPEVFIALKRTFCRLKSRTSRSFPMTIRTSTVRFTALTATTRQTLTLSTSKTPGRFLFPRDRSTLRSEIMPPPSTDLKAALSARLSPMAA